MAGTTETVIDPTDPETGEIIGDITEGGPGTKPPPKRSPPSRDGGDPQVQGGPGLTPPSK